jgi:TPR repeat protein
MRQKMLGAGLLVLFMFTGIAVCAPAPSTEPQRRSLADIRRDAQRGDAASMNELGFLLVTGTDGAARDPAQAVDWFQKAAQKGNDQAMNNLGLIYN